MTSSFDTLRELYFAYRNNELNEEESARFRILLKLAVIQASKRRPKQWNFFNWLEKWFHKKVPEQFEGFKDHIRAQLMEEYIDTFFGHDLAAKAEFISDTHSALDHDPIWHCKVFTNKLKYKIFKLKNDHRSRLQEEEYLRKQLCKPCERAHCD